MATYSNIFIDQGSDFSFTVDLGNADGTSLNLSGYTVQAQMRKSYASTTKTDFVVGSINTSNNTVSISLTNSVTNNLKAGRYVYDVEIVSGGGAVTRVLEGQVEITPGVTR